MPVLEGIGCLYRCCAEGGQSELHPIEDAALAWNGDAIAWVGPRSELPPAWRRSSEPVYDAGGGIVTPGLIDCHTHLAFLDVRREELELRNLGTPYLEILERGGGIRSTMSAVRGASEDELMERAARSLEHMAALGVTTVEAKSGYGLQLEAELKQLRVYRLLAERQKLRLVPTFLGAHVVPPEFRDQADRYVDLVCEQMIPAVAEQGLARFCDVFVEDGAFTRAQARRVLQCGQRYGLGAKLHVDQISDGGGAELAGEIGAVSADHLEHVSERGMAALAARGVVAVSLPWATFFLRQPPMPARRLIEAGVAVAVATDYNPGSAPCDDLPGALLLACVLQGMTAAEVLKGATIFAARALVLEERIGSLEPGKKADFLIVEAADVRDWIYPPTRPRVQATVVGGELLAVPGRAPLWGAAR